MTLISYAQNFEDVMLWRALHDIEHGFYIDVGACCPEADSVTKLFYDNGWRGLNVEPNPRFLALLNERRPDDVNLGVAIGDSAGEIELHVVGEDGLSTTRPDISAHHEQGGAPISKISVPRRTLTDIWERHVPEGRDVQFLKVDAKGDEAAILRSLDWGRYRPWLVVVEATAPNTQIQTHHEWEGGLLEAGYVHAYWDGLNRFYVSEERKDLLPAFSAPPNTFDDFMKSGHADALRVMEATQKSLKAAEIRAEKAERLSDSLQADRDQALRRAEEAEAQSAYLLNRSLWDRALFRPSGRPKKAIRRLLFHTSGKPRRRFRALVFTKTGTVRERFRHWMTSYDYLKMPGADRAHLLGNDANPAYRLLPWRSAIGKSTLSDAELDELMDRIRAEVCDGL